MKFEILTGDALTMLRTLPAESVQCVVTSPPYWGLRDYGTPGQLGLERTPEEYVGKLVEVFREVRRVLRKDGTVWLNLGDSYATRAGSGNIAGGGAQGESWKGMPPSARPNVYAKIIGLKEKDLVGIPWRVAFALQADGWYLRSDIIWAKKNCMPESVTDRPTKSHEYIFLLTKSPRYYFDAEAVREAISPNWSPSNAPTVSPLGEHRLVEGTQGHQRRLAYAEAKGANIRSVWTIATQPFPEAHFATFPEELAERCIKAGTSEKGCCATCGTPWNRLVDVSYHNDTTTNGRPAKGNHRANRDDEALVAKFASGERTRRITNTTGWCPNCEHDDLPIPCTVLDPFCGSGTTGAVAIALQRNFIGIELNPKYVEMANRRIGGVAPLFANVEVR